MKGNGQSDEKSCCYFHPKQVVVGVCSLCLKERLLTIAAKQGHHKHHRPFASKAFHGLQSSIHRKPSASIHKIFAFGSLFSRPESQQLKSENYDYDASSSPEDSFITIKFEENGIPSWEKNTTSNNVPLDNGNKMSKNHHSQTPNKDPKETKSVVEHGKSNSAFRWRKRIGHLFHLVQWKRSTKGGVCHVEGVKVRKGWMRTLTKKKTKE